MFQGGREIASSILNHRPELHRILCNSVDNTINGSISDPVPVLSRVLRDRYRAPYFFFIYIDDLPAVVSSNYTNVNLFADDVLLYHQITDTMSYAVLQETTGTYQLP